MSHPVLPKQMTGRPSAELTAAFVQRGGPSWDQIAAIEWAQEPLSEQARLVAGTARNFNQFYAPDQRTVAQQVEQFLTRHAAAVHAAR